MYNISFNGFNSYVGSAIRIYLDFMQMNDFSFYRKMFYQSADTPLCVNTNSQTGHSQTCQGQ